MLKAGAGKVEWGADNTASVQPFAPDEERDAGPRREAPRRLKFFAPHGAGNFTSASQSGTTTPITSGLGYHRSAPRTAAREIDGVVTWGGGLAPLFVKAGELFRDGEVDVVKRHDGKLSCALECGASGLCKLAFAAVLREKGRRLTPDVYVVEHYPMSDPSAPQMHDLHDDVEVEIANEADRAQALYAVASHRHEAPVGVASVVTQPSKEPQTAGADTSLDDETIERVLSEHIETLVVDDSHIVVTETSIVIDANVDTDEEDEQVVYSPSAPVTVLEISPGEATMDGKTDEEEADEVIPDDELFVVDTTGIEPSLPDDSLFIIDTTGEGNTTADTILYDSPAVPSTSRAAPPPPTLDDESIVYRPRLIEDPVASSSRAPLPPSNFELRDVYVDPRVMMTRKDRKAAKREKRARNKRSRRKAGGGTGDLRIASDGSDLDWGSDGPPKVLAVLGDDDVVGDEELDPDLDDAALAKYTAGMARIRADNAAMAYMESDSDEWDEDDMEETRREIAVAGSDSEDDDDDDDEEEDESSDEDFTALADAYSEDEFASDGEAKLFTGVTQWNDSDDDDDEEAEEIGDNNAWFLDSMESALDGGAMGATRRERNAVFRAVANGSFNDDMPIGEAPQVRMLTTGPAKKNKQAPTHLPQELQDQWARDRAAKAEKKRDRELARALALLDPSVGFGRKANKKKGKKGQAAAARIAHLIPGSAAEIAELFDISDDDVEAPGDDGGWGVTYHRRNPLLPPTLGDVDRMIQEFMADSGRTTLQLPPMEKEARKKVHMLAECYDLKSKSKGKGVSRFP